jgi:hypothetical protein
MSASSVMLSAAVLALASSAVLLRRYRLAVVRLMSIRGLVEGTAALGASDRSPPGSHYCRGRLPPGVRLSADLAHRRRIQIGIAVGAGAFIGLTYAWMFLLWNHVDVTAARFTYLATVFAWPAAPAVWIASDGDTRWTAGTASVLLVAPLLVAVAAGAGLPAGLLGWLVFNALATAVVAVLVTRAFRAVGVCLLGIWLAGLLGAFAAMRESEISLSPGAVLWGSIVMVVVGGIAWLVFIGLARWYAAQGFSDHMLLLGSLCLVFCLEYVAVLGLGRPLLLLIGLALFTAQGLAVVGAYRWLLADVEAPRRLLVLRVFGDARGAARLLDATSARWRHVGPVCLIGGPDLAAANIEPDEFLTFVGRRLRRLFIATRADLDDRLAAPDPPPDPDGRYRVEEWFCFDDTWRPAVAALIERSDVVLLDLRGFTAQRQGTRHELDLLARTGRLGRCVVITDGGTDLVLLDRVVAGAVGPGPRILALESGDPDAVIRVLTQP